jgi:hypothetical protein
VVVSADLRRPRLEQYFGIPAATTGLTTVLALSRHAAAVTGGDEADEVRHHLSSVLLLTGTDGLVVLPSGPVPPTPPRS